LPSQDVKQLSCIPFDDRPPHASMQAWYSFTQALPWLEADEMLSARMAAAIAGRIENAFIDVSSLCPLRRRITSLPDDILRQARLHLLSARMVKPARSTCCRATLEAGPPAPLTPE
jgi:hypothetical protein